LFVKAVREMPALSDADVTLAAKLRPDNELS
jgi:hypothetical protein